MRYALIVLVTLLIVSCRSGHDEVIIPEEELIELLIDIHIADAVATNSMVRRQFGELDSSLIYKPIFEKYGYSRSALTHSLTYYSTETKRITKIYDEVHSRLSTRSEDMRKLYRKTSLSSTKRIWKADKNRYRIVGDTVDYLPEFDFAIDTTGIFVLDAEVRIDETDESINPRLVAYFYNPRGTAEKRVYFDTVRLNKSRSYRIYTLIAENRDSTLNRVKLKVPVQENTDSVFTKNIDIRNLRLSLMSEDKE